jgi:PmbA protein
MFKNEEGKKVFSEQFSLYDDSLLPEGIASSRFDDEGTACQTTKLVERGVLKGFIYDYNTARHLKKQPTGNSRSDTTDFTNIIVKPGSKSIEQEIDKALIIKLVLGSHTSNPITTNFSVNPVLSYCLDKGKKIPVKDFLITGNFINMLKNIVLIDKKIITKENFYIPAIAFQGMQINVF